MRWENQELYHAVPEKQYSAVRPVIFRFPSPARDGPDCSTRDWKCAIDIINFRSNNTNDGAGSPPVKLAV